MSTATKSSRSNRVRSSTVLGPRKPQMVTDRNGKSFGRQIWFEHFEDRQALEALLRIYREHVGHIEAVASFKKDERTGSYLHTSVSPSERDMERLAEQPRRGKRRHFEVLENDQPRMYASLAGHGADSLYKFENDGNTAALAKAVIGFLELRAKQFAAGAKRLRDDMKKRPEMYERLPTLAEFMQKPTQRKRGAA